MSPLPVVDRRRQRQAKALGDLGSADEVLRVDRNHDPSLRTCSRQQCLAHDRVQRYGAHCCTRSYADDTEIGQGMPNEKSPDQASDVREDEIRRPQVIQTSYVGTIKQLAKVLRAVEEIG